MARLILDGLTKKQALLLASWYINHGDIAIESWFDKKEIEIPLVDLGREHGCKKEVGEDIIIYHK